MRKSRLVTTGFSASLAGYSRRWTGRLPGTIGSRLSLAARAVRLMCRGLFCAPPARPRCGRSRRPTESYA